jgi:hypothetical protein
MSSDDVDPYQSTEQKSGGMGLFGWVGVVISAIAAVGGIAAVLWYHPRQNAEDLSAEGNTSNIEKEEGRTTSELLQFGKSSGELL